MKLRYSLIWAAILAFDASVALADDAATGKLTGVVRYEGDIPRSWMADQESPVAEPLPPGAEPDPTKMKPPKPVSVSADRGVLGVVIVLDSPEAKAALKKIEPRVTELDQVGSVFTPPVIVVPIGGKVLFKNSDGINHNVHVLSNSQEKNVFLKAGESRDAVFRQADSARIVCDLHAWMRADLVVVESPYYGVTDRDGHFTIENIPPGKYTMKVLHHRLSPMEPDQEIEIAPGGELKLEPKVALGGR
jgi:plastocyanin